MSIQIVRKENQAQGAFNGGEIIENKPIGFNREGGELKPFSNLFYWAYAEANVDSTIGLHPHQGFEIMSFVLKGEIRHYDTAGKKWIPLHKGDVQIIRAGSGISHAEFMAKGAAMFQIWFDPGLEKTLRHTASYDDYKEDAFAAVDDGQMEVRTLIGEGSPIQMESPEVEIRRFKVKPGKHELELTAGKIHTFYLINGVLSTNNDDVNQDDAIKINGESSFEFECENEIDLFQLTTPEELSYSTYAKMMESKMSQ